MASKIAVSGPVVAAQMIRQGKANITLYTVSLCLRLITSL